MKLKTIKKLLRMELSTWIEVLALGLLLLFIGFHNADWSQNMSKLNIHMWYASDRTEENFFTDRSLFSVWDYPTAYMVGMSLMLFGACIVALACYKIGRHIERYEGKGWGGRSR